MRKGQLASEETCRNISESKIDSHISRISDSEITVGKVDSNFIIPSHRKNIRFNSVDEYKEFLIEHKWSILDFKKNGYCRDQISFFNYILSGNMTLTREKFIEEYCNNLIPLRDIEIKYNIPYGMITFVRDHFGIKRIGHTGLKRGKEETPLSDRQKEIIYGVLLGDASRFGNGIQIKHCVDQKEYCEFLFSELKEHCSDIGINKSVSYDDRSDKVGISFSFHTRNHREIKSICNIFYVNDKKKITKELLKNVTDLSLAIWFMDDGFSSINISDDIKYLGASKIYTCSFSFEENEILVAWFNERYGIIPEIRFKDVDRNPYLHFNKSEADKLRLILYDKVIPSMKYKVDLTKRLSKHLRDNSSFDLCKGMFKKKFVELPTERQSEIVNEIFTIYRKNGFPYLNLDEESLYICFNRIMNWDNFDIFKEDKVIRSNFNSSNMIWHFQPHMFSIACRDRLSPIEIFNDDVMLKEAISCRLKFGGPCNPSGLRTILKDFNHNKSVSNFPPLIAKGVYAYFKKDISVLDFCAGFGGRLLAAIGSKNVNKYVGIDCLKENCNGLNKMIDMFAGLSSGKFKIVNSMAEEVLPLMSRGFDLVFTSPPYFDVEMYSKTDMSQSYLKYPDYSIWLNSWLAKVVEYSCKLLNKDGRIALDLSNTEKYKIEDDFLFVSKSFLKIEDIIYYEVPSITYIRGFRPTKKEKIYIFSKN